MKPEESIAIIAIAVIMGFAIVYIIKAKKSGRKCIGCPDVATCPSKGKGGSSCHHVSDDLVEDGKTTCSSCSSCNSCSLCSSCNLEKTNNQKDNSDINA